MRTSIARSPRMGVLLAAMVASAFGCDVVPFFGARTVPEDSAAGTGGADTEGRRAELPPEDGEMDVRVMQAYLRCLDTCTTGVVGDRATCRLACASSSLDEVPDLSAGAKVCMLPCLETLARCSQVCETTPTPPDDEVACELECKSAGAVCLSHCVEQNQSE